MSVSSAMTFTFVIEGVGGSNPSYGTIQPSQSDNKKISFVLANGASRACRDRMVTESGKVTHAAAEALPVAPDHYQCWPRGHPLAGKSS